MNKLKVIFETLDSKIEFYNKEKGIRDFVHSLNNILRQSKVPFRIYCEYERMKSGKYE